MLFKDIFVPLTICIDQTRRALVIVLPCYGALEIVGVIIIIIIKTADAGQLQCWTCTSRVNYASLLRQMRPRTPVAGAELPPSFTRR